MKYSEFLKEMGIRKLCEECNHDIRDIKLCIKHNCDISISTLSKIIKPVKKFISNGVRRIQESERMQEFFRKVGI